MRSYELSFGINTAHFPAEDSSEQSQSRNYWTGPTEGTPEAGHVTKEMCASPWAVLWKQSTFQSSWAHSWAGTSAPPRFHCPHHFPLWSLAFQTFGGIHPEWLWKCSWSVCGSHSLPGRQRMAVRRPQRCPDHRWEVLNHISYKNCPFPLGQITHCMWFTDHKWNWMKAWEALRGSSPLEATLHTTFKCPQLCPSINIYLLSSPCPAGERWPWRYHFLDPVSWKNNKTFIIGRPMFFPTSPEFMWRRSGICLSSALELSHIEI